MLTEITYSSSLTLSLIYKTSEFDGMRAGFGFLIPKCDASVWLRQPSSEPNFLIASLKIGSCSAASSAGSAMKRSCKRLTKR